MSDIERFDELHVVSDLHLGGVAPRGGYGDRRIFDAGTAGAALAGWIDRLAATDPSRRVGFVINGDFVDFIAAEDARYLDVSGAAVDKLEDAIRDNPAVFAALKRFTARANASLVVLLGNHDVEMMLPAVRERFLREVCGDDAARARVRFGYDGGGFACAVGDRRVHVTHGNESDSWNTIDARKVQSLVRELDAGRDARRWAEQNWEPNPGTRLVVELLNSVKSRRPWVDLLKPEKPLLLLKLLLVVARDELTTEQMKVAALNYARAERVRFSNDLLGDVPSPDAPIDEAAAVRKLLADVWDEPAPTDLDADYDDIEREVRQSRSPESLVSESADQPLGLPGMVRDTLFGRSIIPAFRKSLREWLGDDLAFDVVLSGNRPERDPVYRWFAEHRAARWPEADILIVGHTHLARAVRVEGPRPWAYYNTGTWIRLMRVDERVLTDDARAQRFYDALRGAREYDEIARGGFITQRTTVAVVRDVKGRGVAALGEVTPDSHGGWKLDEWPGSRSTDEVTE
jgi:UDP-2,3-diacylglucosamine pyrophosphatase LpxH